MKFNIRLLYLYLFSFVGLIITVFGAVRLIELGLKVYIFKDADKYEYSYVKPVYPPDDEMRISTEEAKMQEEEQKAIQDRENTRQRQREAAGALAMIIVGFPLYKYHWSVIQKENKS